MEGRREGRNDGHKEVRRGGSLRLACARFKKDLLPH